MQKRCPWCGSPIKTKGLELLKVPKKRTPVLFLYLKCGACGKFCGQNSRCKRVVVCTLCIIASFGFLFLPHLYGLTLLSFIVFSHIESQIPLVRMDARENVVTVFPRTYHAVADAGRALKPQTIYRTSPYFDRSPLFSQSSPIQVVEKQESNIAFYFLYDSDHNLPLLEQGTFSVYSDAGEEIHITVSEQQD